jgi:LysM domain
MRQQPPPADRGAHRMEVPVTKRRAWLAAAAGLLFGCAEPGSRTAASTSKSVAAPAPAASAPPPAAPRLPSPPEPAPQQLTPQDVHRLLASAIGHLQDGDGADAETDLRRVLRADPGQRLAQSLLRQISEDPVSLLGRESFAYRVQPGESLSLIAQRFLDDPYLFYALARYNEIAVPKQVEGGQLIRVPGKAAPPAPAPSPPPAAASAPEVPSSAAQAEAAERQRKATISRLIFQARAARIHQDLDAAIKAWDRLLEIDPGNPTAMLEKRQVVELKEKLAR